MNTTKSGSVNLILTDPPYTTSRKTGFANVKNEIQRFVVNMEFGKWDTKQINLDKIATAMHRVLRTGGTAIVWYDLWKLSHLSEGVGKYRIQNVVGSDMEKKQIQCRSI